MFVHAVYFWLKSDLTKQQIATFREGLTSLTTITTVRNAHIGVPAPTNRPIIERGYSYALVVQFDDEAGQEYTSAWTSMSASASPAPASGRRW